MNEINYHMQKQTRYHPLLGTYSTYDIFAYSSWRPIAMIPDVSLDESLVSKMIQCFNDYELSPIHLYDAVLDMLE